MYESTSSSSVTGSSPRTHSNAGSGSSRSGSEKSRSKIASGSGTSRSGSSRSGSSHSGSSRSGSSQSGSSHSATQSKSSSVSSDQSSKDHPNQAATPEIQKLASPFVWDDVSTDTASTARSHSIIDATSKTVSKSTLSSKTISKSSKTSHTTSSKSSSSYDDKARKIESDNESEVSLQSAGHLNQVIAARQESSRIVPEGTRESPSQPQPQTSPSLEPTSPQQASASDSVLSPPKKKQGMFKRMMGKSSEKEEISKTPSARNSDIDRCSTSVSLFGC